MKEPIKIEQKVLKVSMLGAFLLAVWGGLWEGYLHPGPLCLTGFLI